MKLSIIVPAFNEEKLLGQTLVSIRCAAGGLKNAGGGEELIVCDNNSTDRTAEIARTAGANVVFEPVNQIARARNRGAAAAAGDWLVFVDADSQPSAGLFCDMANTIAGGRAIGGGSTLAFDDARRVMKVSAGAWNRISRVTHWAAGSFLFCEATAFRELGGFNEELFVSEELDLSQRLKVLGRRTARRMVILHRHPLVTSARKLHLYRMSVHLRFLLNAILRPEQTLKRREACQQWYDGRR
jgi:glycosyltransferase involved in cell wall biosynthesis